MYEGGTFLWWKDAENFLKKGKYSANMGFNKLSINKFWLNSDVSPQNQNKALIVIVA